MSAPAKARVWHRLSQIGLVLFLTAMAAYLASLGMGGYRLTGEEIQALSDSGTVVNQAFLDQLRSLDGREYRSVITFVADVKARAAAAAAQGSPVEAWNEDPYFTAVVNAASYGAVVENTGLWFWITFGLGSLGALLFFLPRLLTSLPGMKNDGIFFSPMKHRGWLGIATGTFFIGFYVLLYFHPYYVANWIRLADPIAQALRGQPADRWFFYGLLYTFCVLVMAVRFAVNYLHSRYHLVRTASITFFQLGFAFLIPEILQALQLPSMDLKNAWPLNYGFFTDYNVAHLTSSGTAGWVLLVWGIALSFLVVPAMAAFVGKRWYCSWVCGCGGLAETLGDPYRQLSDKRVKAWRVERWLIHSVLVFAVVMTAVVMYDYFTEAAFSPFGIASWRFRSAYGFFIGSIFAGVVGTGFYPFMGNRVWCRFGCPLAAVLGIVQRFKSRFRITTNGGQCISCGNCSTYCEMGIDVRWYAQRGQNIVRASCVGCGVCSQVCPRGVLRLENGPGASRFNEVSLVQLGQGRIELD